jgi:queuine tRNA-ribosyltransferase
LECFRELFEKCKGRSVELFTYSASTAVRTALLAAGFYVGRGVGTGPKAETTIACTPETLQDSEAQREKILGTPWLERWERSGSRFPHGLPDDERDEIEHRIRSHPQFVL